MCVSFDTDIFSYLPVEKEFSQFCFQYNLGDHLKTYLQNTFLD